MDFWTAALTRVVPRLLELAGTRVYEVYYLPQHPSAATGVLLGLCDIIPPELLLLLMCCRHPLHHLEDPVYGLVGDSYSQGLLLQEKNCYKRGRSWCDPNPDLGTLTLPYPAYPSPVV